MVATAITMATSTRREKHGTSARERRRWRRGRADSAQIVAAFFALRPRPARRRAVTRRIPHMRYVLLALVVVLVASTAHGFDVTSCGQTIPDKQTGFLVADLSCPAGVGVHLGDKATLDLNGHALAATGGSAIVCDGKKCRVLSSTVAPGDVSGDTDVDCISMGNPRGKMTLQNLSVHDCRTCVETDPIGAHGYGAKLTATDVAVDTCVGPGINATKVDATGVSVSHAGDIALWAEMVLRGDGINVSNNHGRGIFSMSLRADNVIANDNASDGVESFKRIRIRGGQMLNNGGWDVIAYGAKVENVECGRSYALHQTMGPSLGICTND
jgi:hypothetical protein